MKRVLLLIGALGLVACVTTNFTLLDPTAQAYPPVPPDSVRIILDVADLDSLEFVRVAVINAKGSGIYTTESEMFKAMRVRAGELGCNAILMPDLSNPGVVVDVAFAIFDTGSRRRGEVVGIRILGPKNEDNFFGKIYTR